MSALKVPLILFSGGLDSTYLLSEALAKGPVDVLYVPGPQGPVKEEAERRAREKIIKLLEERSLFKVRQQLTAPHIDTTPIKDYCLRQPMAWIVSAVMMVEAEYHSEVQIGYILGDQALAFRHEIEMAWNGLMAVSKLNHVPISFPLLYKVKEQIYRHLPQDIQDALWHCELPLVHWPKDMDKPTEESMVSHDPAYPGEHYTRATFEPCGNCEACRTIRNTKERMHLIRLEVVGPPRASDKDEVGGLKEIKPTPVPETEIKVEVKKTRRRVLTLGMDKAPRKKK